MGQLALGTESNFLLITEARTWAINVYIPDA